MHVFLEESIAVLERTPAALTAMLHGLPDVWINANEGPGTWSSYDVLGHLVHCEKADWMPRLKIILEFGPSRPFDPLDREAQFKEKTPKSFSTLLDEFRVLREQSLNHLRALDLQSAQLVLTGTHPSLGTVTLGQLLSAWTVHDLTHIAQVTRAMAKRYKEEVGPWIEHLSVLRR